MAKRDLGDVAATALTRPGVGLALLAALGVYVVLGLQTLLGTVAFLIINATYLSLVIPDTLPIAFGPSLPFAIGVFLSFWQLAPVAPQLRMAHVVTRALLAALVGAVATFVVLFVVAAIGGVAEAAPPILSGTDFDSVGRALLYAGQSALQPALSILIQGAVVVPLAALLLWGRLQSHPPKTAPAGALDEV